MDESLIIATGIGILCVALIFGVIHFLRMRSLRTKLNQAQATLQQVTTELTNTQAALQQTTSDLSHTQTARDLAQTTLQQTNADLAVQRERAARAEATIEAMQTAHTEKLTALQENEQRLRESFATLSAVALEHSNENFLKLAERQFTQHQETARNNLQNLVDPLRTILERQEQQVKDLEAARNTAYGGLNTLIQTMQQGQVALQSETSKLVQALGKPQVRGRWGEMQLRRLVEFAGMLEHCDFAEQATIDSNEGAQRPDLLILLPNQRRIIVDAKFSFDAFNDVLLSDESTRPARMKQYAQRIRGHIDTMAKRAYYKSIEGAYEFTVIFIPGELFYHTALEADNSLLDYAMEKNVILSSPNTLIALLKSTAMGWREARVADDARKIQKLGSDIYDRLKDVAGKLDKLGKNLNQSVSAYNDAVGKFESRLLVSARQMHDMGIGNEEMEDLTRGNTVIRSFNQPDLIDETPANAELPQPAMD